MTVVVLLAALMLIAAPFALSMRRMESGALLAADQEGARAGALAALAAAERHLEDTHPFYDLDTPHLDTRAELLPSDLSTRFAGQLDRNPRGAVRSVRVQDEQGKVHLPTASYFLLANLLGGRTTVTSDVGPLGERLEVVATKEFPATGLLWVGHEVVEYSGREPEGFIETRRGQLSDALPTSKTREHRQGDDVFDLRVLLLAQHGWRHRPGVFDVFRRVDAIKNIGLYGPMAYTGGDVEAVRDLVTVHGAPVAWRSRQLLRRLERASTLAAALIVDDASMWGRGTTLALTNSKGRQDWAIVDRAYPWGDVWRVELFDVLIEDHDERSVVEALRREPVNVNTCSPVVLEALLAGVGRSPLAHIIDPIAAAELAFALPKDTGLEVRDVLRIVDDRIEQGRFEKIDVSLAWSMLQDTRTQLAGLKPEEIVPLFIGLEAPQSALRVTRQAATRVAARIVAGAPARHADLRTLLDAAVADGDINAIQREALLRNAVDPGDAWLSGGTAPFTYSSAGRFTLEAAASENLPSGKERARAYVRRVASIAPGGETAHRVSTQADFEDVLSRGARGRGWTSHPSPLELGGQGKTTLLADTGSTSAAILPRGDAVVALRDALARDRRPPSRTQALVSGGPSPSDADLPSYIAPTPVRSSLPDTVHFDEGVTGLVGSTPKGFSFSDQGSLTLPIDAIEPSITSSIGRLRRFTVDFWFELDGIPDEDIVLFDGGLDELEDRILIALLDGELIFRVHDASLPDYEADVGEAGLVPPTGEIRYAFDDGLALSPGVPYHVLAEVGGAGPRDMLLFVDGVPRGRPSFSTFLTADVPASGSTGSLLSAGVERLPVDSTAGFPRQGVLYVDHELVEYIDLEDDAFLVGPLDDGDPFGGRARRRSLPDEHAANAPVYLAGYSLPLASDKANQGNGTLSSALGEFGVAMLDADRLEHVITAEVVTSASGGPVVEITMGTGLSATASELPVTAAGPGTLANDTFSASGGYAMVVAVHNSYALTLDVPGGAIGETFRFPQETVDGEAIDGVEIIRYTGFNGISLTGCSRNGSGVPVAADGPASDLEGGGFSSGGLSSGTSFADPRVFVTEFDGALTANSAIPDNPRVLIVPLSIPVAGGGLFEDYAPRPETNPDRSALAQIGLDFGEGDDVTEWVRWNTATDIGLVRDDEEAIDNTIDIIDQRNLWNPDASTVDDSNIQLIARELDLRGQCGTDDGVHSDGVEVLPTHLFGGWNVDETGMMHEGLGAPGRLDAITLVDVSRGDAGEILTTKEWHRTNHASLDDRDAASDEVNGVWLVGLRDPVVAEFLLTDFADRDNYGIEDGQVDAQLEEDESGYDEVTALQVDIRLVTRMIKAPSRELPTGPLTTFAIGREFGGRASAGGVTIDELRFTTRRHELDLVPSATSFVLAEELEFDEDRQVRIDLDALRYAHMTLDRPILSPDGIDAASLLSEHGGLLRIGDEIVSYAGLDAVNSGDAFLTGRALYGTRRQAHPAKTPLVPLSFWPAQPLSSRVTATASTLPLGNPRAFPDGPGLLLVDEELIGYTGRSARSLTMPHTGGVTMVSQRGLLRGRFGTTPSDHAAGALVRWMPMRYRDQALLGSEHAEAEHAVITIDAPGAFFTGLAVATRIAAEGSRLDVRGVLDRGVSHHRDLVEAGFALVEFASVGTGDVVVLGALGRQADVVDLHLMAGWDARAFDPIRFTSNGWKVVPEVTSLTLAHIQPTIVWEHEEWR